MVVLMNDIDDDGDVSKRWCVIMIRLLTADCGFHDISYKLADKVFLLREAAALDKKILKVTNHTTPHTSSLSSSSSRSSS